MGHPSTRRIAKLAGCSRMTVVRALRDSAHVATSTRERVLLAARELGHVSNPLLSTVMSAMRRGLHGKTVRGTLGLIHAGDANAAKRTPWARFQDGAESQSARAGFDLQKFDVLTPGLRSSRLQQILLYRGIRGLLFGGGQFFPPDFALDWSQFACCSLDNNPPRPIGHRVSSHHAHNVRQIFVQLDKRGYRRHGLVISRDNNLATDMMIETAFAEAQIRLAPRDRVPPMIVNEWELPDLQRWYLRHRPDVIITFRHTMPRYLTQLGLRIPADIGLVNLCSRPSFENSSGVDWRPEVLGAMAVEMLVEQVLLGKFGPPELPRTVMLDGHWIDGNTLRIPIV